MALTLGDNFSYQGAKPLDARLKYDTVAAMKAVADSTLYDGCLAYCTATEKTYQWKSSNTVDSTLGRWREFESGGSVTVDSALSDASENPVQNKVIKTALDDKADLVDGKIPANQLPSYVDDVLEYEDLAHFPSTGETGKIYIAQDTNKTYRWGGSAYAEISESLALGETSSTAYRGDRGKEAYDVSQTVGSVSSLTTTDKSSVVAAINEVNAKQGLQLGETSTTAYRGDRGKTAYDFSQTPYTSDPEMNGTASAGSSTAWAKGDHVHPSDTTRLSTSGDGSNVTAAFTAASSRANITTGEKLSVIFGKIAKFFTDLKTVAFSGSYNDLSNKLTAGNNISISSENVITANASGSLVNNYTTAEQVIGTWGGKPLYQKTVTYTGKITGSSAGETTVIKTGAFPNIKQAVAGVMSMTSSDGKTIYPAGYSENDTRMDFTITKSNGNLSVVCCGNTWSSPTLIVTVQYTKTTD